LTKHHQENRHTYHTKKNFGLHFDAPFVGHPVPIQLRKYCLLVLLLFFSISFSQMPILFEDYSTQYCMVSIHFGLWFS
jgi:hypothetical protein